MKPRGHVEAPSVRERFIEMRGGRKTAAARVRLYPERKGGDITVNGRPLARYFPLPRHQAAVRAPLAAAGLADGQISCEVRVSGGGVRAQADAVRHGLARALTAWNNEFRKKLRRAGYLTRDARSVERKKYGLKKARRAPQWAKR